MEPGVLPFFAAILLFFRPEEKVPSAQSDAYFHRGKPDATELLIENAHDLLDRWFGRGDAARFIRDLKALRKELIRQRRTVIHRAGREALARDRQPPGSLRSRFEDVITRIDSDIMLLRGQQISEKARPSCRL
jgi:hypothetical protein